MKVEFQSKIWFKNLTFLIILTSFYFIYYFDLDSLFIQSILKKCYESKNSMVFKVQCKDGHKAYLLIICAFM